MEVVRSTLEGAKLRHSRLRARREVLQRLVLGRRGPLGAGVTLVEKPMAASRVGDRMGESVSPCRGRAETDLSGFSSLAELREAALLCEKCPSLVAFRHGVVFGVGNESAELMFVGEAPGADEDLQGEPFVGKAGQLLTKIIEAMGLRREDVYIANVLKCRPDMPAGAAGNRKPKAEEMATCLPWLRRQIELIRPKVMVALGATAAEGLLGVTGPIGKMRGQWQDFCGKPVMVTYHPAYLLRNQSIGEKRKVWEDMLKVLERLGRPISEKQRKFFTSAGA
ncbi:MAG: hypothetical protein Fur0032_08850 [Terrimicrobiaceae bacterium]